MVVRIPSHRLLPPSEARTGASSHRRPAREVRFPPPPREAQPPPSQEGRVTRAARSASS